MSKTISIAGAVCDAWGFDWGVDNTAPEFRRLISASEASGDFTKDVVDVYNDVKGYISGKSVDKSVKEETTAGIDRLIEHATGRKSFPRGAIPAPEALPDPSDD